MPSSSTHSSARALPVPGPGRPPLDELTFLLELGAAARSRPQPEVLTYACRELARLLGVRVSAFVPTRSGHQLKLAICRGRVDDATGATSPQDVAEVLNEVVATGASVHRVIPDLRAPGPDAPGGAPDRGLALAVPLGVGGVLLLDGTAVAGLTPLQERVVCEVGAVLGRLIDHARAAREHEKKLATASAVRQLLETGVQAVSRFEAARAVAATTAAVLGVSSACTYLIDEKGLIREIATFGVDAARDARLRERLVGVSPAGSPVWQRVAVGPEPGPDLIRDTTRPGTVRSGGIAEILGLRSLATIPLLSADGPLGLVTCGDMDRPREWREHDRELLEELALQSTVVVENARLRELERLEARNDALTGLANRRAFALELDAALDRARRADRRVAMLQIDLDRFKEVNDQFGHHAGDRLLEVVADRLRAAVGPDVLVARLGGDEFAVLLAADVCPAGAAAVATAIGEALEQPIEVLDQAVAVEASVGIALFPDHAEDSQLLQRRADRAMYAAKRSGLGQLVYSPEHELDRIIDPGLLGELRRALAEDELVLHYQPQLDLRTGRIVGVEALVRWQHPRLGLLGPDRFVPLAEQTGRIRALTNWVVPQALAQARSWRDAGITLSVAVNVSARDIADARFPALVRGWLAAAGLPGDQLTVELTEGTLMADRQAASRVLAELRTAGVRISIDDFGTGYSSLAYLHSLPIDEIKIDRSFLGAGQRRHSVIRSILSLGRGLGLQTVVEGVEDGGTASTMTVFGADLAQGWYFGRPMTAEQLTRTVRRTLPRIPAQPALATSAAARSPERTAPSM